MVPGLVVGKLARANHIVARQLVRNVQTLAPRIFGVPTFLAIFARWRVRMSLVGTCSVCHPAMPGPFHVAARCMAARLTVQTWLR
jgi:hypothetical protein